MIKNKIILFLMLVGISSSVTGQIGDPILDYQAYIENENFDTTDGMDYENSNMRKHTIDIKEKNLVQLNIDLGQRGVAADDSWRSKPQEKYQYKGSDKHTYIFYLVSFENKTEVDFINLGKYYNSQY